MSQSEIKVVINGQDNTKGAFDAVGRGLAALGQLALGSQGTERLKQGFDETTDASNRTENAILGLTSVANAFTGQAGAATTAAKDLTADGLMSINESATSLKNLLAAGFGLDQAITLMDRFKDSAAFGRQGALGFGESIVGATEGIKNGNSILVDNAGVTKNLSQMLEEAGYSAQDLMKASTDGGVRQAIYNGILRETTPQLGNAAQAAKTYSGAQAQLGTTIFNLKAQAGDLVKVVAGPVTTGMATWLSQNKELVVSAGMAGAAILGFVSILAGAAGLVAAIGAVVAVLGGPLTIALVGIAAILGAVVFAAMQKFQQKMADTTKTTVDGAKSIGSNAQSGFGKAGKAAQDLAKQLGDIDRNMAMAERDFKESMAKMIQDHESKRDAVKASIDQETTDFSEANQTRLEDFTTSQIRMKEEHETKVKDIEDQINAETEKGAFANQERLADLQKRLNSEAVNYSEHYGDLQKQYDDDVAKAKKQYDDKLAQLQKELNDETTLLSAHAEDKKAIQGVMLLDEIDALKRSHTEQMAGYTRQRNDAIQKAAETTQGIAGQFNNLQGMINPGALNSIGNQLGANMANALKQSFKDVIKDLGAWIWATLKQDFSDIFNGDLGRGIAMIGQALGKKNHVPGFASGTDYAPGGMALVGENGPELVNLPRGAQVKTANETANTLAGGSNVSIGEIHFHDTTEGGMAEIWRQLGRGQELSIMGLAQNHG